MKLETYITVGNNVTLSLDKVRVNTGCVGFISLFIPQADKPEMEIELKRSELIEFLLRTQPNLNMQLSVGVHGNPDKTL